MTWRVQERLSGAQHAIDCCQNKYQWQSKPMDEWGSDFNASQFHK
ncbi:hypothetical protein ACN4EG_19060 [Alkalinema pantanalense CENA528]